MFACFLLVDQLINYMEVSFQFHFFIPGHRPLFTYANTLKKLKMPTLVYFSKNPQTAGVAEQNRKGIPLCSTLKYIYLLLAGEALINISQIYHIWT